MITAGHTQSSEYYRQVYTTRFVITIYIGRSDVIVICDLYVVGQHGVLCEVKW